VFEPLRGVGKAIARDWLLYETLMVPKGIMAGAISPEERQSR
jgi:hypothetical protein